ncbi:MAG TPA: DUF2203 domain-containing protein [Acidimicrobiales bacterium]|nr:DUF2203 domain-containing protein [Acidimicrobiales bacterium]
MDEPATHWTVDDARAYLPRLRVLLGVIRRAAHLAVSARGNGHATMPGSPRTRAAADDTDEGDETPVAFDVQQAIEELDERGIVLRDAERGLIDFPALHPGGREVLLCWQLGEDDLAWWHLPEDGFAGRRPLPLPPEL